VGLVDTGRISTDTAHSFEATKRAAPGIAARFYMNRNFFVNDPDAFNTTAQPFPERPKLPTSLELPAAQASIALSAVSGGMYEIGDDMLILGSQKDRLALVENTDLLNIAKIGRASTPFDLMTYEPEDEQPSIFFLQESPRQAILTIFNWTKTPRTHAVKLSELGLPAEHAFAGSDVLNENAPVSLTDGAVRIESQAPESVKVIKLIDSTVPPTAPTVKVQLPSTANAGDIIRLSAQTESAGVPAIAYHWDFGDGISANGPQVSHAYTRAGQFTIRLTVDGIEGVPADQVFPVKVTGALKAFPKLADNRRFQDPAER
jgi:alpha-galactosidase